MKWQQNGKNEMFNVRRNANRESRNEKNFWTDCLRYTWSKRMCDVYTLYFIHTFYLNLWKCNKRICEYVIFQLWNSTNQIKMFVLFLSVYKTSGMLKSIHAYEADGCMDDGICNICDIASRGTGTHLPSHTYEKLSLLLFDIKQLRLVFCHQLP